MKTPTVKLKLHKKRASDNYGYIYLYVSVPGKRKYKPVSLGHKIPEEYWDGSQVKRGYPNYQSINNLINKRKQETEGEFIDQSREGKVLTELAIHSHLHKDKSGAGSFMDFFRQYLNFISTERKEGAKHSKGYIAHWETEYRRLKTYLNGESLYFSDITVEWLEAYEISVAKTVSNNTTLQVCFKKLKSLITRAIDRELIKPSQIAGYSWPLYKRPERPYLTLDETDRIANLVYDGKLNEDPTLLSIACYFIVECYAGIRFSDWSKFSVEKLISKDAFKVRTTKNKEPVYLYLSKWPRLARMVYYIRDNKVAFGLTEQVTNRLLKVLATKTDPTIKINLTTHVGRHTCATLLGEMGYNEIQIADVLGVSPQTVKVYLKSTGKGLKDVQERIGGL